MKHFIFALIGLFLFAGAIQAQSVEDKIDQAEDASKDANKALGTFNLDQGRKDKLAEAKDNSDKAIEIIKDLTTESVKSGFSKEKDGLKAMKKVAEVWQKHGEVYDAITNQILTIKQLNIGSLDELPKTDKPAFTAADAYANALAFATKKYQKSDALTGMSGVQSSLNNFAFYAFEAKEYADAYANFNKALELHDLLKENGKESLFDEETAYNDQMFYAALSANNAEMKEQAMPLYQKLADAKYDKPGIYEGLYNGTFDKDPDAAYKYLEEGRKLYPDDVALLFAEINHYLKINQLDKLIEKLKSAIEKEPNNISLYSTLGNVYDNLYQKEAGEGNEEKAEEYFNSSLEYYGKALEKDPKFFDAVYSMGALYYNKAAAMTTKLNELANDYSKEGLKKYDAFKLEVFSQFDQALPHFKKAEGLDPNDINTLIALKEIYARKDDLPTSNIFKERLDKVQAGGSNDSSYFNK